jgi:cytoskeletal protein CcmA (bactofilin family)
LRTARAGDHRHDHSGDGVGFQEEATFNGDRPWEIRFILHRQGVPDFWQTPISKNRPKLTGKVEGEITGDEIVITPTAVVTARINAATLTIGGQVKGEIVARERIKLLPTARLRCTIVTPTLVLTEGAQFDGDCKMPHGSSDARATVHCGPSGTSGEAGKIAADTAEGENTPKFGQGTL